MFGCATPAKLLQLLKRHRLGYIPRLRIPGDEIPEFLTGKIERDTGMSDKLNHEAIVSTDLAGQEIRERLLQTASTRILVVEFNDLVEAQLAERLGHCFGILDRAGNVWREEVVLHSDYNGPRLVIQSFRLPQLRRHQLRKTHRQHATDKTPDQEGSRWSMHDWRHKLDRPQCVARNQFTLLWPLSDCQETADGGRAQSQTITSARIL